MDFLVQDMRLLKMENQLEKKFLDIQESMEMMENYYQIIKF